MTPLPPVEQSNGDHVPVSIFAAIHRILNDVDAEGYRRVVHIRVTRDAIPGSIVSVPLTPERARVLGRLIELESGGVTADLESVERLLEIVVHPEDYSALLRERPAYGAVTRDLQGDGREYVMSVPVSRDA